MELRHLHPYTATHLLEVKEEKRLRWRNLRQTCSCHLPTHSSEYQSVGDCEIESKHTAKST